MAHVLASELRKAIVQDAIQGKITSRKKDDTSVLSLIETCKEKKNELIKSGNIKKEPPLVYEYDEMPFDIPENWIWCKLGVLVTYLNGYSFNSLETTKKETKYPVIKSQNIMTLKVKLGKNNDYVSNPSEKMLKCKINKGDLLMCLSSQSSNPEPLGKTAIYDLDYEALLNQRVLKMTCLVPQMTAYLYYVMNSEYFHYGVSHQGNGLAQANLKLEHVREMMIPLPPIEEQARIVARVDELMAKIDEYEKLENELVELKKNFPRDMKAAVLQAAMQGKLTDRVISDSVVNIKSSFTEEPPFDIPDSWGWFNLRDLVWNRKQKTPDKLFSYIDIGSIDNINQKLNDSENLIEPNQAPSRARKVVEYGDIIYSTVRPYLHNMAIIDRKFSHEPIASTGFAAMVCNKGVLNKYLFLYLKSPEFDKYANDTSNAKGVAYPAINDKKLYAAAIPLPPIEEQERIVEKLDQLLPLCEELEKEVI